MIFKQVLVGECPPPGANLRSHRALYPLPVGCAGYRLWEMTGLDVPEYLEKFIRFNLLTDPTYAKKWSADAARWAAGSLGQSGLLQGRFVVLLGAKVRDAFGIPADWATCTWHGGISHPLAKFRCLRFALLPHPSGRNLGYNDEANKRRAAKFLRELARAT